MGKRMGKPMGHHERRKIRRDGAAAAAVAAIADSIARATRRH
jgi:hypothetical protein